MLKFYRSVFNGITKLKQKLEHVFLDNISEKQENLFGKLDILYLVKIAINIRQNDVKWRFRLQDID